MRNNFPSIAFGKCYKCGRQAADNGGTSADVPSRSDEKRGLKLIHWRGEWYCEICKTDILDDEASERSADRHHEEESFRLRVGFTNRVV